MATKGPWELISEARDSGSGSNVDLAAIGLASIGGIIYGFGQGILRVLQAGFSLFVDPVMAMVGSGGENPSGAVGLVGAIWGGWIDILNAGAETAVMSLAPNSQWAIGPFTQGLSILSVALGLWLIAKTLQQPWTSNLVPGTLVDNRFVDWIATTPEEEDANE